MDTANPTKNRNIGERIGSQGEITRLFPVADYCGRSTGSWVLCGLHHFVFELLASSHSSEEIWKDLPRPKNKGPLPDLLLNRSLKHGLQLKPKMHQGQDIVATSVILGSLCLRIYIYFARGPGAELIIKNTSTKLANIMSYVTEKYVPVSLDALLAPIGSPQATMVTERLEAQAGCCGASVVMWCRCSVLVPCRCSAKLPWMRFSFPDEHVQCKCQIFFGFFCLKNFLLASIPCQTSLSEQVRRHFQFFYASPCSLATLQMSCNFETWVLPGMCC